MTVSPACRVATYRRLRVAGYLGLTATVLKRARRQTQRTLLGIAAIFLILPLTACQSTPNAPTEALIPVSVPCIEVLPTMPILVTDAELLAMPDAAFIIALAADRLERAKYMVLADAVMQACVK